MKKTVLVQAEVKEESERILNDFGLDLSTAIRIFLFKVKQTRSVPFYIARNKDVLQFDDNEEGFNYLESLMK